MSSWRNLNTPDCCTWNGVSCSNQSGHVTGLNLSGAPYQGSCLGSQVISPYIGELKHLKYLDLSSNNFNDMVIPTSIGSLINLIHLNLSNSGFSGNIPHLLGNLTRLTSLDLSHNDGLSAKSLKWISRLTLLTDINLSGNYQIEATDWTQSIGSLPLLEVLQMDYSEFRMPLSFSSIVSANLRVVSLPGNDVTSSSIFHWLFNTSNYSSVQQSLEYLDLSYNLLKGPIPDAILNLESLTHLDLSRNSFSGTIPNAIGNLEVLTYLDLSRNSLSGTIPDAIGNLEFLTYLDLSQISLSSFIPDTIANLHSLMHLDLSYTSLSGSIPSAIGDLHSILLIDLSNNHLEGAIPSSIANLKYLDYLDLSRNNLSGDIPCKLGIKKLLSFANFSNNNLSGSIPKHSYLGTDFFQGNPSFRTGEIQRRCDKINIGLYVSIGLGFYTGFWAFCGTLPVKNSWRHAYFQFIDHIIDKIYVIVAVKLARFRRNFEV